jgi:osmotically-inducible protein OsmY
MRTTIIVVPQALQRSVVLDAFDDNAQASRILAMAKDRFHRHAHLSVQRIWCEYNDMRLYLRGQVPSFYLKQLAQTAVSGIDGVTQVVNEIEVLW